MSNKQKWMALIAASALFLIPCDARARSFLDSLDDALNSANRAVDDFNKSVGEFEKDVNKTIDQVNKTVDSVSKGVQDVSKEVEKISADVETSANDGLRTANNTVTNTVQTVNGVGNKVVSVTSDTLVVVENGKKKIVRMGNTTANKAAEGVSKTVNDTATGINKTVNNLNKTVNKVSGNITSALDGLNKSLTSVNDGLRQVSNKISSETSTKIDKAGNVIKQTTNNVNSGINTIVTNEKVVITDGAVKLNQAANGLSNEVVRNVNGSIDNSVKEVNDAINTVNKISDDVDKTVTDSVNKVTDDTLNTVNGSLNGAAYTAHTTLDSATLGTPDEKIGYSEKALESMAALGDKWAKLKVEELRAQKMMELLGKDYKSISWFNTFEKLATLSKYKDAQKYYLDAGERTRAYENENPNSCGIFQGLNQINENVLTFKSLFGDKEAGAKLELLRAKREFETIKLKYDKVGILDKLKLKSECTLAKKRYVRALEAYADVKQYLESQKQTANGVSNDNQISNDSQVSNDSQASNSSQVSNSTDSQALLTARAKMDAAFKSYTDYMGVEDASKSKLDQLQSEYMKALEEYKSMIKAK